MGVIRQTAEAGAFRFAIENSIPDAVREFLDAASDGALSVIESELNRQRDALAAAWPKPPSKEVMRGDRRVLLRRTGKSAAGFRVQFKVTADEIVGSITNTARAPGKGGAYVWYVWTNDFNMDGRKGKPTRAWHYFRKKWRTKIAARLIEDIRDKLPEDL